MSTQESLPAPVSIGIDYYVLQRRDYVARHATQKSQPPDYYLAYGDKYCRRFRLELRQRFTPRGQAWIDKTCILLQQMLEQKRTEDPLAFARLEENACAFRSLAYSQHAAAYIRDGIAGLSLHDLILTLCLVDLKDLVTPDEMYQMIQVLTYLTKAYARCAFDWLTVHVIRKILPVTIRGDLTGMLYYYYKFSPI